MTKPMLKLDWCSHEAAKYAVEKWHYSHKLPAGKMVRVGVWEDARFIGCVLFSRGGNNNIGSAFRLQQTEVCELTRVALAHHQTPVSRIGRIAIKMVRTLSPGLRLLVSYADPAQDHHGGIYQAMGWVYAGSSTPQRELRVAGEFMHKRTASSRWGTASPERIRAMTGLDVKYGPVEWKHLYYLPFDPAMRQQIAPLAKPYPKRATSIDSDAPVHQTGEEGAGPIVALHHGRDGSLAGQDVGTVDISMVDNGTQ